MFWTAEELFQSAGGRWSDPNVSAAPGWRLAGIRVNSTDIPTDLCHCFFVKNTAQDTFIITSGLGNTAGSASVLLRVHFSHCISHHTKGVAASWSGSLCLCAGTQLTHCFPTMRTFIKSATTLKTKHWGKMPGRKAYSDPHMKGFTVHVEVLQQTQHILIASWHSQPSKEEQAAFIPHLVVINSRVQTSDYVIIATPSLHFVHAASVAMNGALRSLYSTPAPSFPNC